MGENEDWKKYWTYANLQKSFDQSIMSLTLATNVTTTTGGGMSDGEGIPLDNNVSRPISSAATQPSLSLSSSLPTPLPRLTLATSVKGFPYPAYSTNLGSTFAAVFFGLIFVFSFVITVVIIVKGVTVDPKP